MISGFVSRILLGVVQINLPAETQTSYFFNSSININGKKTNNKSRKNPLNIVLKLPDFP